LSRDRILKAEEFFTTAPKPDMPEEEVRNWYLQAYVMTRYLFVERSKLQFKSFCDALRAGEDPRHALTRVYGIPHLQRFDQDWVQYAGIPPRRAETEKKPFFRPLEFRQIYTEEFGRKNRSRPQGVPAEERH